MFKIFNDNKEKIFGLLAILLIILFAISISPRRLQNDTFYTVTVGKYISENGLDGQDHFSWHEGLPYTYPHWLYDLGMHYIYNMGGWDAIYISTCILTSILGLCIYFSNIRLSKNKLIAFAVTIGSLYLLNGYIAARAQLVTFILFILQIYNIERFLENKKAINAVILLAIHTLIANLHVAVWPFSFVLYLPYIAEYIIAEIIDTFLYKKISVFYLKNSINRINKKIQNTKIEVKQQTKNRLQRLETKLQIMQAKIEKIKEKRRINEKNIYKIEIKKNKNVRWLILILILAIFTGLLTPYGDTPRGKVAYTYTYLTLKGNTMGNINEHLPLVLINNIPVLCTLIIILAAITFSKIKIRISDLFMLGGLTYMMFSTRRQQSMLVLIGTIPFTRILINTIEAMFNYSNEQISKKMINIFTILLMCVIVTSLSSDFHKKIKKQEYIDKKTYPVEASEWILENLDVKKIKLFNEYNYGSYLLYKGIPVFVDSRCDLYTPQYNTPTNDFADGKDIFIDFINCSSIGTYYGKIFEKYNISHAILYKNSKINMIITNTDSEKYKELYSDDNFVIYEVLKY